TAAVRAPAVQGRTQRAGHHMKGLRPMLRDTIAEIVARSVAALHENGDLPKVEIPPIEVMRPQIAAHGDYATNIAMKLAASARAAGTNPTPRPLPAPLAARIRETAAVAPAYDLVASVEVAGPGFINLRLTPAWLLAQAGAVVAAGSLHGASVGGRGQR